MGRNRSRLRPILRLSVYKRLPVGSNTDLQETPFKHRRRGSICRLAGDDTQCVGSRRCIGRRVIAGVEYVDTLGDELRIEALMDCKQRASKARVDLVHIRRAHRVASDAEWTF